MTEVKTKSVMEQVKEFIATHPKFKMGDVKDALPKLSRNQVGTAVWKLMHANVLRRVSADEYELTPVNNTEQPVEKAKPVAKKKKPTPASKTAQLRAQLEDASKEILHWHKEAQNAKKLLHELRHADEQLQDALAVIRYLEHKLFIAIQFNAKNNGNA
jgi:hypothetical protein